VAGGGESCRGGGSGGGGGALIFINPLFDACILHDKKKRSTNESTAKCTKRALGLVCYHRDSCK
jgi:hypothetical protein